MKETTYRSSAIRILRTLKFWRNCFLVGYAVFGFASATKAQSIVNGKVYESDSKLPLEGASVNDKKTGKGELTDRFGYFSLSTLPGDTIQIYLLGYFPKFIVVPPGETVYKSPDVYLSLKKFALPEVEVMARRDTRRDSILNRQENAVFFNYKKPSVAGTVLGSIFHPLSGIESLTTMGKRKRFNHFRERLIDDEHDRFVDTRFTREIVVRLTGLQGDRLDQFMKEYRPTYDFVQTASDYDLYEKIKEWYKEYQQETKKTDSTSKKSKTN